jgi:serine/threonine protein kinase
MSYVYEGRREDGLLAAVKLLRPEFCRDEKTVQRFAREAQLSGQLQHDNIVQIFDFAQDEESGWYFLAMELLSGADLNAFVSGGPYPRHWIGGIVEQVCSALSVAHEQGIVHRDLKPSNIFLVPAEPYPKVKLLDFGVARLMYQQAEEQLTRTGEVIGTPAYVSPEQFLPGHKLTARTDVYALGVVVYQLLTGHLPIDGGSAIAHAVLVMRQEPPPVGEYREDLAGTILESIIAQFLSKKPEERPETMADAWKALASGFSLLEGKAEDVSPVPVVEHDPAISPVSSGKASSGLDDATMVMDMAGNTPVEESGESTMVMASYSVGVSSDGDEDADLGEVTLMDEPLGAMDDSIPTLADGEAQTVSPDVLDILGRDTERRPGLESVDRRAGQTGGQTKETTDKHPGIPRATSRTRGHSSRNADLFRSSETVIVRKEGAKREAASRQMTRSARLEVPNTGRSWVWPVLVVVALLLAAGVWLFLRA